MSAAVVVQNLTVSYDGTTVVDDVSAVIESDRWTVLLGRNGAGKSTLLRALVGIGKGADAVSFPGMTGKRATFCAYVPQTPILPPGMTVGEYVLLGRTAHLGWFQSETDSDRDRALDALEQLDLGRFADRFLNELSGGESQRAVIARAICQDAQILVLDEPTSALDVSYQVEVMDLVRSLAKRSGLTIVSSVHDLTTAARYADDALLLDGGSLVASGTTDEVLTDEILSRHFGTPMHRMQAPDGMPVIVPLYATSQTA